MNKKEIKKEYKEQCRGYKREYKRQKGELKKKKKDSLEEYYLERTPPLDTTPKRSTLDEIGNSVTHGLGALFALYAFYMMLKAADGIREHISACIYFFGLFVMFTASCLYHSFRHGSAVKRLFRRFDYCSIYLLIGATFAPILLSYVGGALGLVFFIVQWSLIAFGITFIGVFSPAKFRFIHFTLYVLLGWSGLIFIPQMLARGDYIFFAYILGGGVVYTLGIIPFAMKTRASHFIWHFFVLLGAFLQCVGIYITIYL